MEAAGLITKKTSVTLRTVHKRFPIEKLSLTIMKSDDDYKIKSKECCIISLFTISAYQFFSPSPYFVSAIG